jgi:hypothetical protein
MNMTVCGVINQEFVRREQEMLSMSKLKREICQNYAEYM